MRGRGIKTVNTNAPWDEDLRFWLEQHLEKHKHLNTVILSRSQYIGVSRQALDSYLDCTYFLPKSAGGQGANIKSSKIEDSIRAYRQRVELPVKHGYAGDFVKTSNWFKLQNACQTAVINRVIVVVYGKPGIGKSRCLAEFAIQRLTTYPVSVLCSRNITPTYFVKEIAQEIGAKKQNSIAATEGEIVRKLLSYPRPIFIDQANYLSEKSLGSVCYIWEKTKVPVVLVGTSDLYNSFIQSSATEDVRAQISSRVMMYYPLSGLTKEEATAILRRALGEHATAPVVAQIYNATAGGFRHIEMIIFRIQELMALNEQALTDGRITMTKIVENAASRLATDI